MDPLSIMYVISGIVAIAEQVGNYIGTRKQSEILEQLNDIRKGLQTKQVSYEQAVSRLNGILNYIGSAAPSAASAVREARQRMVDNATKGVEAKMKDYSDAAVQANAAENQAAVESAKYSGSGISNIVNMIEDKIEGRRRNGGRAAK